MYYIKPSLFAFFFPFYLAAMTLGSQDSGPTVSNVVAKKKADIEKEVPSKNFSRKRLLDIVRRGVVIIKAKAYAVVERNMAIMGNEKAWSGTGFIVDLEKGLIATNHHVIGDMSICTYEVKFSDGAIVKARLRYFDPLLDFAFLAVDPKDCPKSARALEISSEPIKVNDTIYAMGNSGGDEFSTYKGTVFSIYENLGPFPEQSFKFSGLTIPGASGSPLFSDNGKVVGIIYGGKITSGSALPISYVMTAANCLTKNEVPTRKSIGLIPQYENLKNLVDAGMMPPEQQAVYLKEFPDSQNKILTVDTRLVNSPASVSFKSGDIIWKVGHKLIGPELAKLDEIINSSGTDAIPIEVYREGKKVNFEVTSYPLFTSDKQNYIAFAGTTFYNHNEKIRFLMGDAGPGVYISDAKGASPFRELYKQDIFANRSLKITHINNQPIESLDDLEKLIPSLLNKNVFDVRYIDPLGQEIFWDTISADRQERFAILRYDAKFDSPKTYTFNLNTLEWDIKMIETKKN